MLVGCTSIAVNNADGTVRTENGVGIIHVNTDPGRLPQIINLEGFGFVTQNGAITLGYAKSNYAVLPSDDCRVVVWLDEHSASNEMLEGLAAAGEDICLVGPGIGNLMEK